MGRVQTKKKGYGQRTSPKGVCLCKHMGKLIVLEGLDGSGKGTQSKLLAEQLEKKGFSVRIIDFPVYDSESSAFVRLYLQGGLGGNPDDTGAYAASMFFAADRYISYRQDWQADRNREDTILIANRYTTANAYHQLSKLPEVEWDGFLDWLWDFEYSKLGLPAPEQVILLDVPQWLSDENVRKRSRETGQSLDIHETDLAYLAKCRKAALYVAERCGWTIIPCADETKQFAREEISRTIRENLIPLTL